MGVDLLLEEECILVACRVAFALALLEGGSPQGGSPLCRIAFALVLLDGGFPSCEKDLLFEGGSPPCEGGSPS